VPPRVPAGFVGSPHTEAADLYTTPKGKPMGKNAARGRGAGAQRLAAQVGGGGFGRPRGGSACRQRRQ